MITFIDTDSLRVKLLLNHNSTAIREKSRSDQEEVGKRTRKTAKLASLVTQIRHDATTTGTTNGKEQAVRNDDENDERQPSGSEFPGDEPSSYETVEPDDSDTTQEAHESQDKDFSAKRKKHFLKDLVFELR